MRILMINKFLYPNGGSETYIFKLGDYLKSQGHEVQYFGMEHEGRCVGNRVNAYTFPWRLQIGKVDLPVQDHLLQKPRKSCALFWTISSRMFAT